MSKKPDIVIDPYHGNMIEEMRQMMKNLLERDAMRENLIQDLKKAAQETPPPRYYRIEEVAEILQLSIGTLRKAIEEGLLPCHKPANTLRFTKKGIEEYQAKCLVKQKVKKKRVK